MKSTHILSRKAIRPMLLMGLAMVAAGAWFIAIPLGGGDYLDAVRANRSQSRRSVTHYLTRLAMAPQQEAIEVLYAPPAYYHRIGREIPRMKNGQDGIIFYLSQSAHYNDLTDELVKPILMVDGERAALPVEIQVLVDSVHHRTTLLFYPSTDKLDRPLLNADSKRVELILPDVANVPAGENRAEWLLPIELSEALAGSDSLSFAGLIALAAGLLAALSPCLLQQTVYYLGTLTGSAVHQTQIGAGTRSVPRLLPTAIAFVLGFTLIYTSAGAIAGAAGQTVKTLGLLTTLNRPIAFASGVTLIILAVWLAIRARAPLVCKLPLPHSLRDGERFGFFGTVLMGAGIALGCVTCFGGAVFAALMFYLGSTDSALQGAMAMFIFSLAVAIPYLISALAFSRVAPLLEQVQRFTPYLALGSAAVIFFFGVVMITDNFHTLSNNVYRVLAWF